MRIWTLLLLIGLVAETQAQNSRYLERSLRKHKKELGPAGENPTRFEVQIIYTQIDRDERNQPSFTSHHFNVDNQRYFYPASTIKMPTAAIALEKLNQLNRENVTREVVMLTGHGHPPQTAQLFDTTSATGLPSLAHYVKKVFLVSDNDAQNRMYEWCGQAHLNRALWEKGLGRSRIVHRIGIGGFDSASNRLTNPVSFVVNDQLIYHQEADSSGIDIDRHNQDMHGLKRGRGYIDAQGTLISSPFDFSAKNFISLEDLSGILHRIVFPKSFDPAQRFDLSEQDYQFLHSCMSMYPNESAHPAYPGKSDSYVKFFLFGDTEQEIPEHIRIFNKVGWAYGFLTDVAYIVDFENRVEFMLAATIHTNANEVYNDNTYEIEQIALPFLAGLGRIIYQDELKRKRRHLPDLSAFENLSYH